MNKSTSSLVLIAFVCFTLPAALASSSDTVCHKGSIEFGGIKQPILGFAWDGQPDPLSKGIMFETLMDRSSGDTDFVAIVSPESCTNWQSAINDGKKPTKISFYDKNNKAAGIAQGGAEIVEARCDGSVKAIVVKVGSSFNLGMPPS
jgi:hypothetical protein